MYAKKNKNYTHVTIRLLLTLCSQRNIGNDNSIVSPRWLQCKIFFSSFFFVQKGQQFGKLNKKKK